MTQEELYEQQRDLSSKTRIYQLHSPTTDNRKHVRDSYLILTSNRQSSATVMPY